MPGSVRYLVVGAAVGGGVAGAASVTILAQAVDSWPVVGWLSGLTATTQAALIAACAVLCSGVLGFLGVVVGVVLRDFWAAPRLEARRETRERRRAAFAVYTSYADPLAAAAASVFWRLNEAFYEPGRAAYLKVPEPATEFHRYKLESTIYRLAAFLGWIRAFRRELSFFTLDDRTRLSKIEAAVDELERTLAEGRAAEARRADKLAGLWGLKLPKDPDAVADAAVEMEEAVKAGHSIDELWRLAERSASEQIAVATTAARVLCRASGCAELDRRAIEETLPEAVEIIALREAWLFRDQQAAIGDMMLNEVSAGCSSRRRFEVKGYADFVTLLSYNSEGSAEERQTRYWIGLVDRVVRGLDLRAAYDASQFSDARARQLHQTLVATARMLVAISQVQERPGSVADKTVERAKEVLLDQEGADYLEDSRSPKQTGSVF